MGLMEDAVTPEEQREAMNLHLRHKAQEIIEKFGANITFDVLQEILQDRKFVRYPVNIVYDSARVEMGLFITTEMILADPNREPDDDDEYIKQADRHYDFIVHQYFKGQPEKLAPLIMYHLPTVNYGDIATYEDAEVFAAALLQMDQDDYYQLVCDLVDGIPS
ncbi:MAG: hypothetical protein GY820_07770 [Gammaproteobacteria bacterium]|nr:hypothetical protein [Gammaproteobacteria bacterium]